MQLPATPNNRPERIISAIIADAEAARTFVSVLERSDPNDRRYYQLRDRVATSHRLLALQLQELVGVINSDLELQIWTSDGSFSWLLFELATRGIPHTDLDNRLNTSIFRAVAATENSCDANGDRYHYEFNHPFAVSLLASMSPLVALRFLVADILRSFEEWSNFATKDIFEREVLQKLYLLRLVRFEPGPGFGGGASGGDIDPDEGGGASVPRRPLPPHLIGAAENTIPEPEEVGTAID